MKYSTTVRSKPNHVPGPRALHGATTLMSCRRSPPRGAITALPPVPSP